MTGDTNLMGAEVLRAPYRVCVFKDELALPLRDGEQRRVGSDHAIAVRM